MTAAADEPRPPGISDRPRPSRGLSADAAPQQLIRPACPARPLVTDPSRGTRGIAVHERDGQRPTTAPCGGDAVDAARGRPFRSESAA
jgi:hypothetical protein